MTDTTLKSVFTLDTESQTYKPAAHNLSAGEAVERFESDRSARIVDQTERHRTSDPLKCKACKKAAEELTGKYTASAPGSEQVEEETAPVQESEGD
jgi:hypothetical protein